MSDCRIYVACLASYNAGILHGTWIDCTDLDTMQSEVNAILRASPEPNVFVDCPSDEMVDGKCATCGGTDGTHNKVPSSEEFAIHDHEGFGGLIEEYTPLTRVAALAEAIEEHGDPFIAFMGHFGTDSDVAEAVEEFEDKFSGVWDSEKAFAENLVDELGYLAEMPEHLRNYFDYDAWTRDLFRGGDYWRDDSSGAVFRSC